MLRHFVLALTAVAALAAAPVTFELDASHSSAQFSIRHLMISNVKGSFEKMSGSAVWDAANPAASKVEATIDVASINTMQAKRDAHLRSADFFDVAKYPTMTFRSTRIEKAGGKVRMHGDLTLHGVTKPVVFDVDGPSEVIKDPQGNQRFGASATTKINRKEFGLSYNSVLESGGVAVGDEVTITLDVEFVKRK
jgi:polyisoprenoid-binding protein YceI